MDSQKYQAYKRNAIANRKYRDNWERIFGNVKEEQSETTKRNTKESKHVSRKAGRKRRGS